MRNTKNGICYCAVCGKPVPVETPLESGYGYGNLVACTYSHQMVLVRKYDQNKTDNSVHNVARPKMSLTKKQKIIDMRKQGYKAREIALELSTSIQSVYKTCQGAGIPYKRGNRADDFQGIGGAEQ